MRKITRAWQRLRRRGHVVAPVPDYWRPKTYGDCLPLPRPCPYVGCRYNLWLDVTPRGAVRYRAAAVEGRGWPKSVSNCALDHASDRPYAGSKIGQVLGYCGRWVNKEIDGALARLRGSAMTR